MNTNTNTNTATPAVRGLRGVSEYLNTMLTTVTRNREAWRSKQGNAGHDRWHTGAADDLDAALKAVRLATLRVVDLETEVGVQLQDPEVPAKPASVPPDAVTALIAKLEAMRVSAEESGGYSGVPVGLGIAMREIRHALQVEHPVPTPKHVAGGIPGALIFTLLALRDELEALRVTYREGQRTMAFGECEDLMHRRSKTLTAMQVVQELLNAQTGDFDGVAPAKATGGQA